MAFKFKCDLIHFCLEVSLPTPKPNVFRDALFYATISLLYYCFQYASSDFSKRPLVEHFSSNRNHICAGATALLIFLDAVKQLMVLHHNPQAGSPPRATNCYQHFCFCKTQPWSRKHVCMEQPKRSKQTNASGTHKHYSFLLRELDWSNAWKIPNRMQKLSDNEVFLPPYPFLPFVQKNVTQGKRKGSRQTL